MMTVKNKPLTVQKIHADLRKAGFKRSTYTASGRVKGYGWSSVGYELEAVKVDNPEWMGFGIRSRLPKFLHTGIYELSHTSLAEDKIREMGEALTEAGIEFEFEELPRPTGKLIIDISQWDGGKDDD